MSWKRLCLIAAVAILSTAAKADVLAFTPSDTGTLGDGGSIAGWGWAPNSLTIDYRFQVTAPINVTALAYYSLPEAGFQLNRGEIVSIYQAGSDPSILGTLLASATVTPAGLVQHVSTNVDFFYTSIAPLELAPGAIYQITEAASDRSTFFYSTTASPAPGISLVTSNPNAPISFGGDFFFNAAVPEPSTWAMLLLGFAGLGFMAYRRKSKLELMAA
jgi:PEP-CTERM motif